MAPMESTLLNTQARSSMRDSSQDPGEPAQNSSRDEINKRVRTNSQNLLQGGRELLIAHAGEEYRLRLTRNDKLILTK